MSLYAEYVKEREGKSVIEHEHGFATYYPHNGFMYIEDIYVIPTHRKTDVASQLADQIATQAKEAGYNKLLGSVSTLANNPTVSVKVLLSYGFKVLGAETNMIWFSKEIE